MKNLKFWRTALVATLVLTVMLSVTGGTIAWFTDSVASNGNKIEAGTLDIDLYQLVDGGEEADDSWVEITENSDPLFNSELWEPGYTAYQVLKVQNNGTLALKWKAQIVADAALNKLAEVIDVYTKVGVTALPTGREGIADWTKEATLADFINNAEGKTIGSLTAKDTDNDEATLGIALKMREEAGNEYQGLSLGNLDIKILATQEMFEEDSFNNEYDKEALFSNEVDTLEGLKAALAAGGQMKLTSDIAVNEALTVTGDVVIDLNGKELDASALTLDRPFYMSEGASLTINGAGATVKLGDHGLVNVPTNVKNAEITLNGGTYTGITKNGAMIRLRAGNEHVDVTLNGVTYQDAADDGYIVSTQGFTGEGKMTVNGGSYTANYGFQLYKLETALNNVTINTKGTAVEAVNSNVLVNGCTIVVDPGVTVVYAPGAGIAASNGGTATVKNSTISGSMQAVYYVYSSGGRILAENNNIEGATCNLGDSRNDAGENGTIEVK